MSWVSIDLISKCIEAEEGGGIEVLGERERGTERLQLENFILQGL